MEAPSKLRTFLQEWPKPYSLSSVTYYAYHQPPWQWLGCAGTYGSDSILRLPLAWQAAWAGLHDGWDQPTSPTTLALEESQPQKILVSVTLSDRPAFDGQLARRAESLRFTDRYGLWLWKPNVYQRIGECRLSDDQWDHTSMRLEHGSPLPELAEVLGGGEWQLFRDRTFDYSYCWQHQPSGFRFYPRRDGHANGTSRWVPSKLLSQRRWYGSFGSVREMRYLLQQRRACTGQLRRMYFHLDGKQWTIRLGQRSIRTLALPANTGNTNAEYETFWASSMLVIRLLKQLDRLPASETVYWYLVDEFGNAPERTRYLLVTWLPAVQHYYTWD
jgi:hypothetical protein